MTPRPVASAMVAASSGLVVDLAAGTGRLLEAHLSAHPDCRAVGVEKHPGLAVAAGVGILAARAASGEDVGAKSDRIYCGDGLCADGPWCRHEGSAAAVALNPPYLGEKGNRQLFDELRDRHDHLAGRFGARIDLAYLFVHRGLDFLGERGRLALLTPEYWLTATGASGLRADLGERTSPQAMVRLPTLRLFDDAPGHHSLLSLYERKPGGGEEAVGGETERPTCCEFAEPPEEWSGLLRALADEGADALDRESVSLVARPDTEGFGAEPWTPFVERSAVEWGERLRETGTPLEDLLQDRQGFVSGADRVTARRLGQLDDPPDTLSKGDPVFLWRNDELTDRMRRLRGLVVRPLLRGSRIVENSVRLAPPREDFVLYLDGELDGGRGEVVEHMEPLEPALARRREVRRGRMPWYRLHWPRSRREQTGMKLVVPRRAEHPTFTLDLSASAVSSDCTYLVAPEGTRRPLRYLLTLMLLLNGASTDRYLRRFGKRKGELLEFYSEPLRSLPLPVERTDGELTWVASPLADRVSSRISEKVDRALRRIRSAADAGRSLVELGERRSS